MSVLGLRSVARPALRAAVPGVRAYSWSPRPQALELAYDVLEPAKLTHADQCFVICHGLFGSKQNWRSLAKSLAKKLEMPVYTLDMRNHGISPHAKPHSYEAMSEDIALFLQNRGIKSGMNLLGHSMGGKAVMAYALNKDINSPLRSLVSVDMAPAIGKVSPEFQAYIDCMREVESSKVNSRSEADEILQKVEPELSTRQFLLTNTRTESNGGDHLVFRLPLDLLSEEIPSIGAFPYTPPPPASETSPTWDGPVMFLKGAKSKYINKRNIPICEAFFPNMKLETLDAGHWVHAEQPAETVRLIAEFVKQ